MQLPKKLDAKSIKDLQLPRTGMLIYWDSVVTGLGVRVTANGARSFVLRYRTRSRRDRTYTIGSFPEWEGPAAREEAKQLKRKIDRGGDPLADLQDQRNAPTVTDMCERYVEEHLPKKRPSSQGDDRSMIRLEIMPALGKKQVREVTFADVDAIHRKITRGKGRRPAPHRANRVVALLSKMFGLAIKWGWRADNPAKGVERNPEAKRERYLKPEELVQLTATLGNWPDQETANIIRLLLLTGARLGEVLSMRWANLDLKGGIWTKPGATTKQKTVHVVPLNPPAREILAGLSQDSEYVFPGRNGGHRNDGLKKPWQAIRRRAKLAGLRLHDLRHSYASFLASAGYSLPTIGALLGHTQPQTTHRYAHLLDDPLRQATDTIGAIIAGKPVAEIVPIKGRRV